MPELRGGPYHKLNPAIPEPYRPFYPYYEHDEECDVAQARSIAVANKSPYVDQADCTCTPRYLGAYVVTLVQQKSRTVRHFLWHEGYEPPGGKREPINAERFLRLRRGVLQGPL